MRASRKQSTISETKKPLNQSEMMQKLGASLKQKVEDKKRQVGFDLLMYVQDLKVFHNENDVPRLIENYLKRHGSNGGDVLDFQKRNLVFYRKQLDYVEQRLIKLIQKFN